MDQENIDSAQEPRHKNRSALGVMLHDVIDPVYNCVLSPVGRAGRATGRAGKTTGKAFWDFAIGYVAWQAFSCLNRQGSKIADSIIHFEGHEAEIYGIGIGIIQDVAAVGAGGMYFFGIDNGFTRAGVGVLSVKAATNIGSLAVQWYKSASRRGTSEYNLDSSSSF